jgi:hypothetical protein
MYGILVYLGNNRDIRTSYVEEGTFTQIQNSKYRERRRDSLNSFERK